MLATPGAGPEEESGVGGRSSPGIVGVDAGELLFPFRAQRRGARCDAGWEDSIAHRVDRALSESRTRVAALARCQHGASESTPDHSRRAWQGARRVAVPRATQRVCDSSAHGAQGDRRRPPFRFLGHSVPSSPVRRRLSGVSIWLYAYTPSAVAAR